MRIEVKTLCEADYPEYEAFIQSHPNAMLYHTLGYKDFLGRVLSGARAHYLTGFSDGEIKVVLPMFIQATDAGVIINSLPFYGSHGGLLAEEGSLEVIDAVIAEYEKLTLGEGVISATVVEPVFPTDQDNETLFAHDLQDYRIGQISTLPKQGTEEAVEKEIMSGMHQKARNSLRRGLRGDFKISHEGSVSNLNNLERLHCENMAAIGGQAKSPEFFSAILEGMEYDKHYRIYMAHAANGDVAATLLVLYFKNWVEYFVPASHQDYRSKQPLSVLILKAMTDAVVERRSTLWNWGGTWASQDGVYRFKSRWGAKDYRYRYFIRLPMGVDPLVKLGQKQLQLKFPFFYSCPYKILGTWANDVQSKQ